VRHTLKSIAGIVACASTATAMSSFLQDAGELRMAALAASFIAVIATAILAGRLTAALGALSAAIVFAVWLFPPIGSIAISEPEARIGLTAFLLASASITVIAKTRNHTI